MCFGLLSVSQTTGATCRRGCKDDGCEKSLDTGSGLAGDAIIVHLGPMPHGHQMLLGVVALVGTWYLMPQCYSNQPADYHGGCQPSEAQISEEVDPNLKPSWPDLM